MADQLPRYGLLRLAAAGITRSRSRAASWTRMGTTSRVGWASKCRYVSHTTLATRSVSRVRELTRETLRDMVNRDALGIGGHHRPACRTVGPLVNHATDGTGRGQASGVDDAPTPDVLGARRAQP